LDVSSGPWVRRAMLSVVGVLVGSSRLVVVRCGSSSLVRRSGHGLGYSFGHVRGGVVVVVGTGWQLEPSSSACCQGQRQ